MLTFVCGGGLVAGEWNNKKMVEATWVWGIDSRKRKQHEDENLLPVLLQLYLLLMILLIS